MPSWHGAYLSTGTTSSLSLLIFFKDNWVWHELQNKIQNRGTKQKLWVTVMY